MSFTITPSKLVDAVVTVEFDFESQLQSGETIVSQAVTATVFQGLDSLPGNIISGAASVSGTTVYQKITDGVAGVVYLLNCGIVTSNANELIMQTYLAVTSTNPFQA